MALAPAHSLRPTREDLQSIIERALEEARSRGATQAEAAVSQNSGLSVGVRLGEVETLEHQRDRSMGITVYFGQRKGSASTADFSPEAVQATVAKACSIARFTAEDAYAGLADAALMARSQPDLDLDHPWDLSAERAIEIAKDMRVGGPRVRSAHQQFRGRVGQHPPGVACVRKYPRIRGRLSDHLSHRELRGPGGNRGGHAAGLLVLDLARLARPRRCRGDRARKRAAHHRAARAPQAHHAARGGAVRARDGARSDRPFLRRDTRQQPIPAIVVSA